MRTCAAIGAVLLVSTGLCAAAERHPDRADLDSPPPALNQPVSLEPVDVAARGAPVREAEGSSAEATASATVVGEREAKERTQYLHRRSEDDDRRLSSGSGRSIGLLGGPRHTGSVLPSGLGPLAVVLALVGALAWAVRRWLPSTRAADNGLLRVVGRTSLSPKHTVCLIQLGQRFVMVGLSGDRLTTLADVVDEEEVGALAARIGSSRRPKSAGFEDLLLTEASHYDGDARSVPENPGPVVGTPRKRRSSLTDLLRRVRTLQVDS